MRTLSFYVPGPPRGKERPRLGKGRTYTPAATVAAEKEIAWEARRAMKAQPIFAGALKVVIQAVYQIPKSWSTKEREAAVEVGGWKISKPDVDNIAKLVKDALNPMRDKRTKELVPFVWNDDSQVVDLHVYKSYSLYGAQPEGLHILISELGRGLF